MELMKLLVAPRATPRLSDDARPGCCCACSAACLIWPRFENDDQGRGGNWSEARCGTVRDEGSTYLVRKVPVEENRRAFFDALYDTVGESWRIAPAQSLLTYAAGQTTATFTDRKLPDKPFDAANLTPARRASAQQACAAAGVTDPASSRTASSTSARPARAPSRRAPRPSRPRRSRRSRTCPATCSRTRAPKLTVPGLPGWTADDAGSQSAAYGAGGLPDADEARRISGGQRLFFAGTSEVGTIHQDIGVGGHIGDTLRFGGAFGGFAGQEDAAALTVTFLDAAGTLNVSPTTAGPVTAAMRKGETKLLPCTTVATVPAGAVTARLTLVATKAEGSDNDGYADNLFATFTPGAASCG